MTNGLSHQLAFRVPQGIVDALDLLVENMEKESPGVVRRRSDAARVALYRGLQEELKELQQQKK